MYKILTLVLFLFIGIGSSAQNRLFTVITDSVAVFPGKDSTAVRGLRVTASVNQLRLQDGARLLIPLPGRAPINVIRGRVDTDPSGRVAWYGKVENDPGSFVLFSLVKNVISGQIQLSNGKKYRIAYKGKNVHEIAEIDLSRMPDTRNDMIRPDRYDTLNVPMEICADAPNTIDVMVIYTPNAEAGTGADSEGELIMESLIYQNIYLTNIAYENSNITQRIRLVHIAEVAFTESGSHTTDANTIQDPTNASMNTIRALRNTHHADIVVIMVETLDLCGWAFIMPSVTPAHEAFAYSLVKRSCADIRFTFPHELGHIMGARHNWHDDPTDLQPYAYNHGHIFHQTVNGENVSWKTIMSANTPADASYPQIEYFSNPNLNKPGTSTPLGNATANNTLTLNNTASTVAAFRCGSPPVDNVWMRDTYNDTGQEPDPATATQSMCMSPYIWVRNDQDVVSTQPPFPYAHQHEHQNPIFGQDNWVYVKLHNGATSISGTLEVYGAFASSGLVWPGSWTLIKSLPLTMAPQSTRIAEMKWDNVPARGHYCLLARWVSAADPMSPPETPNVNTNTRQSNNIIWRNLNIVDLSDVNEEAVEMFVENNTEHPLQLVFEEETRFPKVPFLNAGDIKAGNIIVIMDSALCYGWQKGKSEYKGLEPEFARIKLLDKRAELNNITLPPGKRGKLTLIFKKGTSTPRDRFLFTVKQYEMNKKQGRLMGEVGYEVYTYKR